MTINAQGYFDHLRAYISNKYIVDNGIGGEIKLKETYFLEAVAKKQMRTIKLKYKGDAFALKLDGGKAPLFHFLENQGHPWSKRCDFVIFHRSKNTINVHCIEFKSNSLNYNQFGAQLKAGVAWCGSLNDTIKSYTQQSKRLSVRKFLFSSNTNPVGYLSPDRKYIQQDPSIRFYHYDDVNGTALEDLENSCVNKV